MKLFESMAFSQEKKFLGHIVAVDFLGETVTLADEKDIYVLPFEDVTLVQKVGTTSDGEVYYNHDVLENVHDETLHEMELLENGKVALHRLDEDSLKRTGSTNTFTVSLLMTIIEKEDTYKITENLYELLAEEDAKSVDVDFNIKIYKEVDTDSYFYACNNKKTDEIDLIKVVFLGSAVLTEESYSRNTVTKEVFSNHVLEGLLSEVSTSELQSYAMNLLQDSQRQKEDPRCNSDCNCDVDEDCKMENEESMGLPTPPADYNEYESDNICDECDAHVSDCDCDEEHY